eukprot:TRINITY_DN2337_c0_g1_i4.p1 TRINITY_DN2337_c0_g1~~TRINITY_DN2337_c0_g1_i4.p1  ORF type:complete len:216 (+),score=37.93 TRINITY_DN2337_c0_g1_i4:83-649(+)
MAAAATSAAKHVVRVHGHVASPTAFLARAALNLKGVDYWFIPLKPDVTKNQQGRFDNGVMPLVEDGEQKVHHTGSIFNFINEKYPEPPFLPPSHEERARVRSIATFVSTEIQPFGYYRVDMYLNDILGIGESGRKKWHQHWLGDGFRIVDSMLQGSQTGKFCHGDQPTMADLFLIPQVGRKKSRDIHH